MTDRKYWLETMLQIVDPVLKNLSQEKLKEKMPVASSKERVKYSYLEAFGRSLSGIAPWLELNSKDADLTDSEKEKLEEYSQMARDSIRAAVDPDSADYMVFNDQIRQPLVDTAFLAQAIIRAPQELWHKLDSSTKENLVRALKSSRQIKPYYCNWLLFSAVVEAALAFMGEDYDSVRIDYALREHQNWYLGDGVYGDGPEFHFDYYNSFVIQPMMLDIIKVMQDKDSEIAEMEAKIITRARRYGEILEKMIAPDGTYPPLGRSITYRFGVFQLLSQLALINQLPASLNPAQVRTALTAVIKKVMSAKNMFDQEGWLTIGLYGKQPDLGEEYINTGSLYLASEVFMPLGLDNNSEFWSTPAEDWSAKKIWSGENAQADHSL
ncbi:hypothetical protein C8C77_1327 [Halanaerobium saccharolyticum]|uniref:DUF2264 domain-containing protein n=1 Tax=Halanaerobium saccharolyticum TaxID=43595 RepID=A0A4R7YQ54_9FIRM|nr:DUF2264 domain-containing protein [Halanaerobium saccharolyticum]RAK05174.1 hypothetical protein C7958_1297 [Halanaerobium saccharolyticum]TDV99005.1 hypothetical protein C8C77_1327 [Halanaerobium saccharolyticum]TDX51696.1 hypothetical protein C7956_1317 [Halanaerobium saccharolyticum]